MEDFYKSFMNIVKRTFDENQIYKELILKINNFEGKIKDFSNRSDNNASEFRKEMDNFFLISVLLLIKELMKR